MLLRPRIRAFTLLEIFVVLGIIAMFLALLIPFAMKLREGGRSAECVRNLQRIGKGILMFTNEHEGRLPGPLTADQNPVASAGNPPRDGQLLKFIAKYLEAPANSPDGPSTAKTAFMCPSWQRAERATDAPVFMLNTEPVSAGGQPVWGSENQTPLTLAQLKDWKRKSGDREEPVDLAKMWALADCDQVMARIVGVKEPWVSRLPATAVHMNHRNALYFDWHVDHELSLHKTGPGEAADGASAAK